MENIEDQEISWPELHFFLERESEGIPFDVQKIAQDLDMEGNFYEAERFVIDYQRITSASSVVLEIANQEKLSLRSLLDGTIGKDIGPTTVLVARMVVEKLIDAAVATYLRTHDLASDYADVRSYLQENRQAILQLHYRSKLTFQLFDKYFSVPTCKGGEK